jgi:hypothetical protein
MFGLQKADVRLIRGVHLEDPETGWTHDALHRLLRAHKSFTGFCDAFFEKPMSKYQKVHWAEKTPANVLQFRKFMQSFEDAYIVHVVRNPYDTVASLVARGMSAYRRHPYIFCTRHMVLHFVAYLVILKCNMNHWSVMLPELCSLQF